MFSEELARDRQRLDSWLEKTFSSKENGDASSIESFTDYDAEIFENASIEHGPGLFGTGGSSNVNESRQDIKKPFQVLTFLCSELQLLESYAKKRFYPALYVIGKSTFKSTEHKVGDSELHLATMLPMLQDVSDLLEQLDNLLTNIFRQISAIVLEENLVYKRRMIYTGLRYISRGLIVLMTIQTLISLKILPLFFDYRRMLHTMTAKTDVHGVEMSLLEDVQHQVLKLEESLRLGAFTSFIDSKLKDTRLKDDLKKKRVSNMIEGYIKETVESLMSRLNMEEEEAFSIRFDILGTLILFITYVWLGSYSKDKKLLNAILEIHEKAPILPLYGNLIINPSRLIAEMLPDIYLTYLSCDYIKRSNAQSKAGLQNLLKNLESKLEGVAVHGAVWSTELLALIPPGKNTIGAADKELFLNLLFEGLNHMLYLQSIFDQVMHFHVEQMIPMSKKTLKMTTNCLWYLKLVAKNIANLSGPIQQNFEYINEHYKILLLEHLKKTYELLQQVDRNAGTVRVRKVLFKLGSSNPNNTEDLKICISLVKLGIEVLHDTATVPQRLLITFIIHAISGFKFVPEWVESEGMKYLKKMEFVEHLSDLLENLGSLQFLFFHPEYMRNSIEQILLYPSEVYKLQNLLDAFLDVRNLAAQAGLGDQCNKMFEDEMISLLKLYLIEPLSLAIKKDLLSLVYESTSSSTNDNVEFKHNFLPIVHVKTLKLITTTFNLQEKLLKEVVKNLRRTARDGALEWTSICKIKTIAWQKYQMRLDKIDPSEGTISTSLEVLSTLEGLKIFLSSHMFQLHSMTFILNPGSSTTTTTSTANSKNDTDHLKIVEIEEFMDFIQADVIYRGSEVLESIFEIKASDTLMRRSFRKSSKSAHQFLLQQHSKKTIEDEVEHEISNIDNNENIIDNEQSSTYPVMDGSDEPKNSVNSPFDDISHHGKAQWSFINESHKRERKDDEESSNSIVAVPSVHSNSKGDKVSGILNMIKEFLSKKLFEVCELCMYPETRSVFFQATQRWLNSQNAVGNQYPAAQADIVRKEITALMKAGTLSTNPIHRLRFHIMDIGKLVALLLMIFHGAICVRDRALAMLPKEILKSFDSFEEFLISLKMFDKVVNEGALYDRNLDGLAMKNPLREKFIDMLEEIFKRSIDENKAEHLKSLFIFLPAMSLNHIESMISLKNQYQNTLKSRPICITEDSFAFGTSYLLSMLNQSEKFSGLNWFDSVYKHYQVKFNRIKVTVDTQQTIQATLSRQANTDVEMQRNMQRMESLKETMKEIKLLEYSMLSSMLFFQFRDTINDIES